MSASKVIFWKLKLDNIRPSQNPLSSFSEYIGSPDLYCGLYTILVVIWPGLCQALETDSQLHSFILAMSFPVSPEMLGFAIPSACHVITEIIFLFSLSCHLWVRVTDKESGSFQLLLYKIYYYIIWQMRVVFITAP